MSQPPEQRDRARRQRLLRFELRRSTVAPCERDPQGGVHFGGAPSGDAVVLQAVRAEIPDDNCFDAAADFIGSLITVSAFDLGEGKLTSFAAYRFLYERLLGGAVRPWLPSAFVGAAALPYLHPALRKVLLRSIGESAAAAPGWSSHNSVFTPEWVEKVPEAVF